MIPRKFVHGILASLVANFGLAGELPEGASIMHGISSPAVSPDGKTMVFEWLEDLWVAPTMGGEAVRMVNEPGRDAYPLFTPDGSRIVFSSDRSGSLQVYSMPTAGGDTIRHTWNSEGSQLECVSPDGKRAIVGGLRERAGFRSTRLEIIDLHDGVREQRVFDATADAASWSPDGKRVLFTRRGEQLYRKGYKGARASQIWEYDIPSGKFELKVANDTESRSPFWHPDGKGFHFLSAADGTLNLWSKRDEKSAPVQITRFTGDGMIFRSPSQDHSVFVFHRGQDVFRMDPAKPDEPVPLVIWTREQLPDKGTYSTRIRTTIHADFTQTLDRAVFSAAGEIWSTDAKDGKTIRLTTTPEAETEICAAPDGGFYFLRDDGLEANYHHARLEGIKWVETGAVTRGSRSKCRLRPSPDGSKIAWIEGTGDVFTADKNGENTRRVFPCWDRPTFDWSPDGKWLAIAAEDRDANRDIWLAAVEGDRTPVNLTRHPAFEGSPRWSPDGRHLVFSAKRDPDGRTALWWIDFGAKGISLETTDKKLQQLAGKPKRVSTGDIEPTRAIWKSDSKRLLFQNKKTKDSNLYEIQIATSGVEAIASQRGVPIRMTKDGTLLWRVKQKPAVFGDEEKTFPIAAELSRSRESSSLLAFRRIWRTLGERFYDASMNGTDWDALRLKYEAAAASAHSSRQFDRIVSQLFGELNASHLSFLRKPWPHEFKRPREKQESSHPGMEFKSNGKNELVIKRVIRGTPVARLSSPPKVGDKVVRIAGQDVNASTPLHPFFNGVEGSIIPVVIREKKGVERVIEVKPVSYRKAREQDLAAADSKARVRCRKVGKISYFRVPDMKRDTIDCLELEIHRASADSEAMVLDLRNNGGGREADRLLAMFCQPEHSITRPRGGPDGYPLARRVITAWSKPLVVLCNENTFSNAEIFCHAMKATGRAPLVGTATVGGVISAVKEAIPEAGELQVPFRGWYSLQSGKNLDLNGATPDYPVEMTPDDENRGKDPQLEKALEILKKSL